MLVDIEAGDRLSTAAARHSTVFPAFYVRLLRVAEATGELSTILAQVGDPLERRKTLRDRVRGALVYPAIALVVGAIAGFVLATFSLPALMGMLGSRGGDLPLSTQLLTDGSQFLKDYGGLLAVGAVLLGLVVALASRTPRGSALLDRATLRVPAVGRVVILGNMFSLMSTLTMLMRGGVATVESVRLSGEEMGNSVLRHGMS